MRSAMFSEVVAKPAIQIPVFHVRDQPLHERMVHVRLAGEFVLALFPLILLDLR